MDKAAVVLLNYNGKAYLEKFLPEIIKYSTGYSIYVIDNASTDESVASIKMNFPQVKTIILDQNYGFSGGYNLGLRQVKAEYYILLNTDVAVTSNWINPVLQLMENDKSIAACQPKILSYHQPTYFEYAGAAGGYIDALGYPFCRGRIFDHLEEDLGQYNDTRPVFWASGACFFIQSGLFHRSGGFDHDFFAHMEEIDLCWRLNSAGYKIYYCADSTVFHVGGGTLSGTNPHKTYLNFRNNLTMLYKNSNFFQFLWKYSFRLALDYLAALRELLKQRFQVTLAILRAHLHFWKSCRVNNLKKITTKSVRKGFKVEEIYPGSIVIEYFFKKKKTFGALKF